jgi:hypothetical protein
LEDLRTALKDQTLKKLKDQWLSGNATNELEFVRQELENEAKKSEA